MKDISMTLSEDEAALISSMRRDSQLESTILQLSRIGRDEDPGCYSADDAEESIHRLGEELKRAALKGWAQSSNDKEMGKALASGSCRRSKKNS